MAQESTYKITLIGNHADDTLNTRRIVSQFAKHRNIPVGRATTAIQSLITELQNPITETRKERILNFFRHVNFGNYTLIRVKRKYVRKGQEPVVPNPVPVIIESPDTIGIVQPVDMQGLTVPMGTVIVMSKKGDAGTQYRIVSFADGSRPGWCRLQHVINGTYTTTGHEPRYQVSVINRSLKNKTWHLRTETPELLAKIETYSNVVLYRDFKRCDATPHTQGRITANNAAYVIEIDGNKIPVTPGFTGNCQLTIIGNMVNLVSISSNLKVQLQEIHRVAGRKLLLCDVNEYVVKQLQERLPKTWFHSVMPYTSTNKSQMAICLINISKK